MYIDWKVYCCWSTSALSNNRTRRCFGQVTSSCTSCYCRRLQSFGLSGLSDFKAAPTVRLKGLAAVSSITRNNMIRVSCNVLHAVLPYLSLVCDFKASQTWTTISIQIWILGMCYCKSCRPAVRRLPFLRRRLTPKHSGFGEATL